MEDIVESKIVVITGASGGIGAATALKLGTEGHALVLAARRRPELERIAGQAAQRTLAVVTDATVRGDVERLREAALAEFGRVDVWINNAGRGISRRVLDLTDAEVDEIVASNLKSVLYGMQAIVPHFQARGEGHLINVSSFLGRVPFVPFRSIYSAAKSAVNILTANLRMDLRTEYPGIHVSLVLPGVVKTGFGANALGGTPAVPFRTGTQMRPQEPEEVAEVIAALIKEPKPEIYTNPGLAEIFRNYYQDVGAFEDNLFNPARE